MPRSFAASARSARAGYGWLWLPCVLGLLGVGMPAACQAGSSHSTDDDVGTTTGSGGDLGLDGGGGGSVDQDSSCVLASGQATEVPVNLLIMFDKSGSMLGPRWTHTTAALQAFFADPASAGLRVGLSFFPDPATGCDESCNVAACAVPKVPPAALTDLSMPDDAQEQLLFDAFNGLIPSGGTPMSAALEGALDWATGYLSVHPAEKAAVILVTDGEPLDCNTDVGYIAGLATTARTTSGVLTFAIGLTGSNGSTLDHIAAAGGTGQAFMADDATAQQALLAALTEIRQSTVACEFEMPATVEGQPVKKDYVNVFYTPATGSDSVLIGHVPSKAGCTADKGGWYYDNPDAPTRIIFCDSTCVTVQSSAEAKVEVVIGCTSVPA